MFPNGGFHAPQVKVSVPGVNFPVFKVSFGGISAHPFKMVGTGAHVPHVNVPHINVPHVKMVGTTVTVPVVKTTTAMVKNPNANPFNMPGINVPGVPYKVPPAAFNHSSTGLQNPFASGIAMVPGVSGYVPVLTGNLYTIPIYWHRWHHWHDWNDWYAWNNYTSGNPYYNSNYQSPYLYQNYAQGAQSYPSSNQGGQQYSTGNQSAQQYPTGNPSAQPYGYPTTSTSAPETVGPNTVAMYDDYFVPSSLEIKSGTTITWKNFGTHMHSLVEPGSAWKSDNVNKGGAYTWTFTDPGTFVLVDPLHSSQMRMTIVVK